MLLGISLAVNAVGVGGGIGGAGDGVNDEVDNGKGQDRDNKTNDSVEDSVFGVGNLFAVATGDNIAETAVDKHYDRYNADDVEDGVSNLSENAIGADEVIRHAVGAGGLGAFLDGEGGRAFCDRHQNGATKA